MQKHQREADHLSPFNDEWCTYYLNSGLTGSWTEYWVKTILNGKFRIILKSVFILKINLTINTKLSFHNITLMNWYVKRYNRQTCNLEENLFLMTAHSSGYVFKRGKNVTSLNTGRVRTYQGIMRRGVYCS